MNAARTNKDELHQHQPPQSNCPLHARTHARTHVPAYLLASASSFFLAAAASASASSSVLNSRSVTTRAACCANEASPGGPTTSPMAKMRGLAVRKSRSTSTRPYFPISTPTCSHPIFSLLASRPPL